MCYNIDTVRERNKSSSKAVRRDNGALHILPPKSKGEKTMLYEELDVMEYAITMETLALEGGESVEDDFDDEPYFSECGFNPYMGCYDFDC